jgi:hypothetical protein
VILGVLLGVTVVVGVPVGVGLVVGVPVAVAVGVEVTVGVAVADGLPVAVGVGVAVGPDCAQYLPPVFVSGRMEEYTPPPQIIISVPLHTAVWRSRGGGALLRLVAAQLSVLGSYLPPVLTGLKSSDPPQTIISVPVHTAV